MIGKFEKVLQQWWGYNSFRGIQKDIISSIYNGKDTLGLMPTGGGKSITFQVPALMKKGVCLVITPLIALMKDQVNNLRQRGIKAAAIYTGMTRDTIITALENCIFGDYKLLYISPERLSSDLFLTKLKDMHVSFITVDEAHCISQWGYDFRPSYLQIGKIRQLLPDVPVLALTATATLTVVKDIQRQLGFQKENVFRMSFERKNLAYVVRPTEKKPEELIHILKSLTGCAIVYTRNRKKTKEIAEMLITEGISSIYYHAGLDNITRDVREKIWKQNEVRVMVATNAFGMGIDKPDVRCVIHADVPDSLEAYFQEAGRAGRDGQKAYAILLYSHRDTTRLQRKISDTFPDKEFIRQIYEHLAYFYQLAMGDGQGMTKEFDINKFCYTFKHHPVQTESALILLTRAGYIDYRLEENNPSRVKFLIDKYKLYQLEEYDEDIDNVCQGILRAYSGLFSDYVSVEEAKIADISDVPLEKVYPALISLARLHVISYIPHKRAAYITYKRPRLEASKLNFSKEIYEKRKEEYKNRIDAIIEYAEDKVKCRSRMLLNYFGERSEHNCEQCDICLYHHPSGLRSGKYKNIYNAILEWISNKDIRHFAYELKINGEKSEDIESALHYMLAEHIIGLKDGEIYSKK